MGLWAEAIIEIPKPKMVNIKSVVQPLIGEMNETILKSNYSKSEGVVLNLSTTCVGEEFDELIYTIMKELSKADVGHYYINVTSNWYLK